MTHETEREFRVHVREWFERQWGHSAVETDVYQPGPRWFVDLVVQAEPVTLYVEVENDAASIRDGVGQALGYAAGREHGVPLVVVPAGHTEPERVRRLRATQAVQIRAFDAEEETWI